MLLKSIYELARILVLYVQKAYYKDPEIINASFLKLDKPTIVVSNHPNTLLDAVFSAAAVSKQVFFLANYSLFKSSFGNWFFSNMYCIPIQRPEDVDNEPIDNRESLIRSHKHLKEGGNLYIAVEGYSIQTIGIRELKTGAARIALNTQNENDWKLDLQILPIGINYNQAGRFRSNLVINVGQPFKVHKWKGQFDLEARMAARDVTDYLKDQLESLTFGPSENGYDLFQKIRHYFNQHEPTDPKREYLRARQLFDGIHNKDEGEILHLEALISSFEQLCAGHNLYPEMVLESLKPEKIEKDIGNLIWSLPITIYGFVINIVPFTICHWIEKKLNNHREYEATFRVLSGIIFFPLMYLVWMYGIYIWSTSWILSVLLLFTFRRSGIYSWHQIQKWKKYFSIKKINKLLKPDNPVSLEALKLITILKNLYQ